MNKRFSLHLLTITCLSTLAAQADPKPLPSPAEFEPARYLGKWFEVARLPTAIQPEGSLAIAEYSASDGAGTVVVKNSAYDAEGEFIGAIEGRAQIVEGTPKGRLKVAFGPTFPEEANYCVLSVHPKYRFAVVGSPDRKSMWILSRKVPVGKKKIAQLAAAAAEAGFDTSALVSNKWPKKFAEPPGKKNDKTAPPIAGAWTFHIAGPDGEIVEFPMELETNDKVLSGRIGRRDGRWLALKEGKVDGDSFSFTVVRDRDSGGSMTYKIDGKYADGKLTGTAATDFEGHGEITSKWDADRKK